MNKKPLNIVILGLSLSSSWGNGHATTYRSLIKGLYQEGHRVTFLERDVPWYASHRDLVTSPHYQLHLYKNLQELQKQYAQLVEEADLVIVGSYVPEGVEVGKWTIQRAQGITAFYDIDTPITLEKLKNKDFEYISPKLIQAYDAYFSFTGGPILDELETIYNSPSAKALYCSVDTDLYFPQTQPKKWKLGYLGTYSADRQPPLQKLLIETAQQLPEQPFVVAGPQYPQDIHWPHNVERMEHLPPARHATFYNQQQYTLNITRAAMIAAGYAPSVRLFEAAACATPIISDFWEGLDTIFKPGEEFLIARNTTDVMEFLQEIPEEERERIGQNARERILKEHSFCKRAKQLAQYVYDMNVVASSKS